MGAIASQITSLTIVYATVYSDADQRKHHSPASLAFVWGIYRRPVNSPHKWPVTRKMFPFDDVIMSKCCTRNRYQHTGAETKMYDIFQTTFSNTSSWMKMFEFRIQFVWSLFQGVQLTKYSIGSHNCLAPNRRQTIIWNVRLQVIIWNNDSLSRWRIYASFGLNEWRAGTITDTVGCNYVSLPLIEDVCARSIYQGQGQVITSHKSCGVWLHVPTLDTCIWLNAPHSEIWPIFYVLHCFSSRNVVLCDNT